MPTAKLALPSPAEKKRGRLQAPKPVAAKAKGTRSNLRRKPPPEVDLESEDDITKSENI